MNISLKICATRTDNPSNLTRECVRRPTNWGYESLHGHLSPLTCRRAQPDFLCKGQRRLLAVREAYRSTYGRPRLTMRGAKPPPLTCLYSVMLKCKEIYSCYIWNLKKRGFR